MKKLLVLLMVVILATAVLIVPAAANEETITIWAMGMEGINLGRMIPQFEKANPGIKVKLQQIPWGGAHEKIITAIAGGTVPDICQMGSTWMPEFSASRVFESLDGYIIKSKIVKMNDYFKAATDICKYKGRYYGIPWYVDTRVLVYRNDILKTVGYSKFPDNWSDFMDCLRKLKARGANMAALSAGTSNYQEFMNFVWQNGGRILDRRGKPTVTSPAFVGGMAWYANLFKEKLALLDNGGSSFRQDLNTGRSPIAIVGPYEIPNIEKEFPNLKGK